MLFNNTNTNTRKKKRPSHLHYGTSAKAKKTIKYLLTRPHSEQVRGAQTMYYRAKYHAKQTPDMRSAMDVYEKFLNKIKSKKNI